MNTIAMATNPVVSHVSSLTDETKEWKSDDSVHDRKEEKTNRRLSKEEPHESVLLEVWKKMLGEWSPSNQHSTEPARVLIYTCPIPAFLRAEAWYIMSGARDLYEKSPTVYHELTKRKPRCLEDIEKDLPRTYVEMQKVK